MKSFSLIFLRFYVKLQDAYASEANKVGSWKLIGYVAPGAKSAGDIGETTNFKYYAGTSPAIDATEGKAISGEDAFEAQAVWGAVNVAALNECGIQNETTAAAANWKVSAKAATNGNSLLYKAEVTTNCKPLTPTFDALSSKGYDDN
jgi:hypothetical protein